MFRFIVTYLGFLKRVPLMAGMFDAFLMIWNMIVNPKINDAIEKIEKEVLTWKGVHLSAHKFGGLQFNYLTKEIGHIHSNGILDIPFSRKIKDELIKQGKATEHHVFNRSGWVSFYIQSECDTEQAIRLLELSYLILLQKSSNISFFVEDLKMT